MTITNKLLLSSASLLLLSTICAPIVQADEEISLSANTAIVSDYRFRGFSLSKRDLAIQGGLDLSTSSGFYLGTWASSIESYAGSETELDFYGGYGFEAGGLSYDVGAIVYAYPGSDDTHYLEGYGSVSGAVNEALGWSLGVAYAFEQDNIGGSDNLYIYGGLDYAVPDTPLSFSATLGRETGAFGKGAGEAKIDWSLGVSYSINDSISVGTTYVDTNLSGVGAGKGGVVFTVGASF